MADLSEKKDGIVSKEETISPGVTRFDSSTDSEFVKPLDSPGKTEIATFKDEENGTPEGNWNGPTETVTDFVTEIIHAEDDPSLNPWTFRTWFLGFGLSAFGSVLSTIYFFKPQALSVSTIFLGCISYVLGEMMSHLIPRKGRIGRLLNPHPVSNRSSFRSLLIRNSSIEKNMLLSLSCQVLRQVLHKLYLCLLSISFITTKSYSLWLALYL
jgi:hypothetical protein